MPLFEPRACIEVTWCAKVSLRDSHRKKIKHGQKVQSMGAPIGTPKSMESVKAAAKARFDMDHQSA